MLENIVDFKIIGEKAAGQNLCHSSATGKFVHVYIMSISRDIIFNRINIATSCILTFVLKICLFVRCQSD